MQNRPILVTGASGFIGSRLVKRLVERGHNVRAFVRPGSNLRYLLGFADNQVSFAYGDITIAHTVYRALHGCSQMYHLASNYRMWDRRPERILIPALEGTRAVLNAARARNLEKVVITSSVGALGAERDSVEMDERHPFNLTDAEIYVQAKKHAHDAALSMAKDVPLVLVLPSGVVGPGDWKPTPTGEGIIKYLKFPTLVRFPVTRGGLNLVDVDDVAEGHIQAMESGRLGESYILSGENVTYAQMFTLLSDVTGLPRPGKPLPSALVKWTGRLMELSALLTATEPDLTYRLARDYATSYLWVTSKKAEKELGYTHRPARTALSRAVQWYLAHGYIKAGSTRPIRAVPQAG